MTADIWPFLPPVDQETACPDESFCLSRRGAYAAWKNQKRNWPRDHLSTKRIGRTKVRSLSGAAAGGGGNGAARVSRESASVSSTAEPELLMTRPFST